MSTKSLLLLIVQFSCLFLIAWKGSLFSQSAFAILSLLGFMIIIWSIVAIGVFNVNIQAEPKTRSQLITKGPYRWARHPI